MKKWLTCCPVAKAQTLQLIPVDFQFQPGKPVSAWEAEVEWVQESESTVCLTLGNEIVKFGGRYTDREGYLSSVDEAFRESRHLMNVHDINAFTPQGIQIQVDIIQTPVLKLFSKEVKFSWDKHAHWRQYDLVADSWCELQHPNQPISPKNVIKPIKKKILLQKHVAWHTKMPINLYIEAIEKFKANWTVGLSPSTINENAKRQT